MCLIVLKKRQCCALKSFFCDLKASRCPTASWPEEHEESDHGSDGSPQRRLGGAGRVSLLGKQDLSNLRTFDNFTSEDSHIFSLFPQLFNRKLSQSKDLLPCQEAGGTSAEDRRTPSDRATIVVTCCHTRS